MAYGFPENEKKGVRISILTRKDVLNDISTELAIMGLLSTIDPDCPFSPAAIFAIVCANNRQLMSIMKIHPLDIIVNMNKKAKE